MSNRVITRRLQQQVSTPHPTSKLYTGEIHQPDRERREPDGNKMISDTECLCLVMCDGVNEPDYQCSECKGTGTRKFFSLYEQTLMSVGRKHCYEGYDSNTDELQVVN